MWSGWGGYSSEISASNMWGVSQSSTSSQVDRGFHGLSAVLEVLIKKDGEEPAVLLLLSIRWPLGSAGEP